MVWATALRVMLSIAILMMLGLLEAVATLSGDVPGAEAEAEPK